MATVKLGTEEYASNSHKSKTEAKDKKNIPEKKVEKVTTGTVKKKTGFAKVMSLFIAEDITNVKEYVIYDILIPSAKRAIDDIISEGIHMLLYKGEPRGSRRSGASKVSYDRYYRDDRDRRDSRPSENRRSAYDYDTVLIPSRAEAENVLELMNELIDRYDMASIADFYDLVGVTGEYTDEKYGWKDLRSAEVMRSRDGYQIRFPKVIPLD